MRISIEYKLAAGLIIAFSLVLILAIATRKDINLVVDFNQKQNQSRLITNSVNEIRAAILEVEASSRGFALTGNSLFLKDYDVNVKKANNYWKSLTISLKDDPFFIRRKKEIDDLISSRIAFADSAISVRKDSGIIRSSEFISSRRGNKLTEDISEKINELENHAYLICILYNNSESQAVNKTISLFYVLVSLIVLVLAIVFILFKNDLTWRRRSNAKFKELNENLEIKVEERVKELAESELKYRFLAEHTADVISLNDLDGKYIYISDSVRKILGFTSSEMIGQSAFDFIHPDDVEYVKTKYVEMLKRTSVELSQFRHRTKDGNYIWLESVANLTYDDSGTISGRIINTRDISQRKKIEQQLAESKSRMNALIENSMDAIWAVDNELNLIGYNKLYHEITKEIMGIDVQIGMKVWEILDEEPKRIWKNFYDRAIAGERFSEELTETYGGAEHIHEISFNPISINDVVTGIAIFAREITLRKKNEQEVIESSARMKAVLENSSDSIWSVDKDLNLVSFNHSYYESTKLFFDIEPYRGMPMLEHLNSESRELWAKLYERALNGEHFSEETEDTSIGLELFFDISFNPIIVNNEITGVAIFARDISSRKNVERQLEYKVKELNTFMYKATHDLRSPLVSVMGLVQLAKDQTSDEELLKYFDMIDLSVHKMDNLLIDLVKIVNVSQGKLVTESIDFDSIIDDILLSLSHYPEFSEIVFRRQIHSDSAFKSDRRLLYSIFQNLIDNTIKYKKPLSVAESIVIITANVTPEQVQIGITDNGQGIAEGVKDRVFEMFYRGNSSPNGTGLGLYIVKTSVEKLGGKIMLNSIEGKGTSINIIIPNA